MVIQCPKCKKQYNVDSDRITESGVKITCPGCRHQFIARRKADEKEKRKAETRPPKTPACTICGQPSTHVLRGPPPRPLCEHHFQNEKEKESRFWETNDGFAPPGVKNPVAPGPVRPGPDPAQTQAAPPKTGPASPAQPDRKPSPPPPDAEPAFESFDDFDFFDEGPAMASTPARKTAPDPSPKTGPPTTTKPGPSKPGPSKPGLSKPGLSKPGLSKPGPSKPGLSKPGPSEASFDFDDEVFARPEAPDPAAPRKPAAPPSPPGMDDGFGSREIEFPNPSQAVGQAAGPAADPFSSSASDPFSSAAMDPFNQAPMGLAADPGGPANLDEDLSQTFKQSGVNLDGSPEAESFSDFDDRESSFAWKKPEPEGGPQKTTALDHEMNANIELARPLAPPPPTAASKKTDFDLRPVKLTKPRDKRAAAIMVGLMFLALAGSAFLSITRAADRTVESGWTAPDHTRAWRGQLEMEVTKGPVEPGAVMTGNLDPAPKTGPDVTADLAAAWKALLPDTRAAADNALHLAETARAQAPDNPDPASIIISILALRESQDDQGKTSAAGRDAGQAYADLPPEIQNDPALARARAHVLINTGQAGQALDLINNYLETNADDPLAYYIKGQALRSQSRPDPDSAVSNLTRAVELEPGFVRARWELAQVLFELGRKDEAAKQYQEIAGLSPDRAGVEDALKTLAGPGPGATAKEPVAGGPKTTPDKTPVQKPTGIRATGGEVSDNIKDNIKTVDQYVRRLHKPGYEPPERPRPPEEGPTKRPPEEGP